MKSTQYLFLTITVVTICFCTTAQASIIYESATFAGATGSGTSISGRQTALGSRFYIDQPVQVTAIGGYIWPSTLEGTYLGAIVPINGPYDYPMGKPLDPGEVVASTVFQLDYPARDYRIPFSALLEPGYYVVVLGTDNLSAQGGYGYMPHIGQTNLPGNLGNMYFNIYNDKWLGFTLPIRFVVEGTVIPEPATVLFLGLGIVMLRKRK